MDDQRFTLEDLREALEQSETLAAEIVDMEHMRKVVIAQEVNARPTLPLSKAESLARGSQRYVDFLAELKAKRQAAAKASARADYMRMRWESWRSTQATKRVKEQLHG